VDKDIKVESVDPHAHNLSNCHYTLIATTPQVDGVFTPDRAPESTEYTDIDNRWLLPLETTVHTSRHDAETRMLWHRSFAHVGLKGLERTLTITNAPRMTGKCNCECCIKRKLPRRPFTQITTACAAEPLQLVHSAICSPLETAIGGGDYMLLFIDNATRHG
jgi:hypothetical protein